MKHSFDFDSSPSSNFSLPLITAAFDMDGVEAASVLEIDEGNSQELTPLVALK